MNLTNLTRPGPLIVLIVVLVLLFGAKRLPDAARSLGRSLRIIKAETKGLVDDGRTDDLDEKADAQTGRQPLTKEPGSEPATGEVIDPPDRVRDNN
jgi:sec-independent protein translocase protein TatA